MATQRYDLKVEANNVWTVIDVFTGQPVVLDGYLMSHLQRDEADDLLDILNLKDAMRRGLIQIRRRPPEDKD
ncbi:hypothetical protein [Ensifer sp. ENS11]|uniref:hypothetical protein n=1 Tax=Ensifer sp. ENS11 TaxID=2769291 RepID=UPI00177EDE7F|nr:hypothetical protein [Ensifer sp. ENS11]MBD9491782.1 hypothetical protein [Ensifer sp. ENS11]MDP9634352.1 putative metal-binding protein [Ensifer adhaerens]